MDCNEFILGWKLLHDYQETEKAYSNKLLELANELHSFIDNSEYKPAYNGSLLDIIGGIEEPLSSRIIANILNYRDKNKRYTLLESFIKELMRKRLDIRNPKITAEKERLDVAIRDRDYVIIIENKLKNADFQRNQLARYIARMNRSYGGKYDENEIYIIILPQFQDSKIRLSAGRLPKDWKEPNDNRKCKIAQYECWCDCSNFTYDEDKLAWCAQCDKDILNRLKANTYFLHDNFAEWLIRESENLPADQWPLRSCMMQFAYYLKGLYYTRYNSKLDMDITKFLKEKILSSTSVEENWKALNETIADLNQLISSSQKLRTAYAKECVEEWEQSLQEEYSELRSDERNGIKSFGLNINGVWVGCWAGDNAKYNYSPYWGFYLDGSPNEEQIEMVERIVSACDVKPTNKNEGSFIMWGNTLHGDERCRSFYQAAKEMGYH